MQILLPTVDMAHSWDEKTIEHDGFLAVVAV
jgi:hypothetical protein